MRNLSDKRRTERTHRNSRSRKDRYSKLNLGVVTLEAVLKLMEEESPPGNPSGVSCGSFMKAAVE